MNSKTSFFSPAILRMDVTRYAPVWGLYTAGFLMIQIMELNRCTNDFAAAIYMDSFINMFIPINGLYAMTVALVLFGDLLNPRLCSALHALPLTRDSFFRTHTFAGFCFSIIPNALVMLISLPLLGKAAPMAVYAFLIGVGCYIFFFGTALLSVQLAGNRIAAVLIYGLLNFGALLPMWFARYLYEPMMYGVELPLREVFLKFCPTVSMMDTDYLFLSSTEVVERNLVRLDSIQRLDTWGALGIWTLVGLAELAAAQILYRCRKLETAGDLVSFKATKPVLLVLFTLMAAGIVHAAAYALKLSGGLDGILVTAAGLAVGWILGQMLLEKQVWVFSWRNMAPMAAIVGVFALTVILTVGDVFGVVSRVPDADQVDAIRVHDAGGSSHTAVVRDPALIQELTELHARELKAYSHRGRMEKLSANSNSNEEYSEGSTRITMEYVLKDGTVLKRTYEHDLYRPDGRLTKNMELFRRCFSLPSAVFSMEIQSAKDVTDKVSFIEISGGLMRDFNVREDWDGLVRAILADCAEETTADSWWFHTADTQVAYIFISYTEPDSGLVELPEYRFGVFARPTLSTSIGVYASNTHTVEWLVEQGCFSWEELDDFVASANALGY